MRYQAAPYSDVIPYKGIGVNDGARTHDNRNHNPGLYQLSYIHRHKFGSIISSSRVARLTGFEPVTIRLEGGCSIQLSYRRVTMILNIMRYRCLEELVGAVGFEPTTLWSQTRCATRLRHTPIHLSFVVSHIVRYGVHSRRDAS